jgi:hypothetical protein
MATPEPSALRGKAFVQVLSCVLSRLVAANDAVRVHGAPAPRWRAARRRLTRLRPPFHLRPAQSPEVAAGVVTKFHALRPPTISIRDYLER